MSFYTEYQNEGAQNADLFDVIRKKIEARKTKTKVEEDIKRAQSALDLEMLNWYKASLLISEVQQVILDYDLLVSSNESTTTQVMESVKASFTAAQASQCLHKQFSGRGSLLGVSEDVMLRSLTQQLPKEFITQLLQTLSERLSKRLIAISNFYQPSQTATGPALIMAKSVQLDSIVRVDVDQIERSQKAIQMLHDQRVHRLQTLQQSYCVALQILSNLLANYKCDKQFGLDQNTLENLLVRAQAFSAKLRVQEAELLADTYRSDIVHELQHIRGTLDTKIAATQDELGNVNEVYSKCIGAGKDFETIANLYSQTLKEIADREWALQEFRASCKMKVGTHSTNHQSL